MNPLRDTARLVLDKAESFGLWKVVLWLAGIMTAAYYVLPNTPTSKLILYNGVGALALGTVLIGVVYKGANPREPYMWFAAGLASFLTADVLYYVDELFGGVGYPTPADLFYLGMYPLMIVGLNKMVIEIAGRKNNASLIDAGIVATAFFGLFWVLWVDDQFTAGFEWNTGNIVTLAYPVMDIALLAVAARLVVTLHLKHPPFAIIAGAIGSLAIADTAYNIYLNNGTFKTGLWLDFFWLLFYTLFAVAAVHPAARKPPYLTNAEGKLTARQLVIMFFATVSVPMADLLFGNESDKYVTTFASVILFMLILVRVFTLMKELEIGQEKLKYDAGHDALTGLVNRVKFSERTAAALRKTDADENHVAVLFIDLDDFKNVNDSLGHAAGDAMLAEAAARLTECVNEDDTVARFGGDEFAILIEKAKDRRDAVLVANRTLEAFNSPIDLGVKTFNVSASIGIAMDYDSKKDVESLMRNADVAMYLSKARGKGRFEFFEPVMHQEAIERLDLKADLAKALDNNELVLHYQPIFDLNTGKVKMVEALIRWRHPTKGLISPDRFIPLAEESGLIVPIGDWVIQEACRQTALWRKIRGCEDLSITVNLSIRQLQDTRLVNTITHALTESGLASQHLVVEITESMLAHDAEGASRLLEQLKTIGVKIAIDDFGTGYSSLSYLKTFPVDSIKIDRSFINELARNSTSTALIETVVNLSRALGAYTVAEGIEHQEQAATLRRLGCDRAQGFYYCRPLAAPALTALFRDHTGDGKEPLEAWRQKAEKVHHRVIDIGVRTGLKEIQSVANDIRELNKALESPLMASYNWLETWFESFPHWTPMMVEVRSAESAELMACAFFATIERAEGTAIVAAGHGSSQFSMMQSRTPEASAALASAISSALNDIPGAWSLELEQVADSDHTLAHLVDELEQAQTLPELRIPRVAFSTAHDVNEVLSKSMRKQLRRAQKKITNDGRVLSISFDRGKAITPELIDEVEAVHISRDRHARRHSDLDRPAEREFWRQVCEAPPARWEVEIASLRLDGKLAAYVVALLDGNVYRVYDGRMNTEFQEYSPGRLIEAAALARAIADDRYAVLDWMNGVAAEKLLTANMSEGRARLVATSAVRYLGDSPKAIAKELSPNDETEAVA
ncbi:MAG: GNAT family N-acetyltransferase [Acidimicrobiales bacterium]